MKFVLKRQLRWLIFLLVPFVCLLMVHVLVPLLFLTESTPLLQETYNIEKKNHLFRTIYSFQQINQQIITSRLTQHYRIFEDLHLFIQQQHMHMLQMDHRFINLNNGYNITQAIAKGQLSANYVEPVSMWFATNCSNFDQMNDLQKQTYFIYSSVQPYLRSLAPIDSIWSLVGIKTRLSLYGVTIAYQYPSKYQQQFASLNGTVFSAYDQFLLDKYITKNQSITAYLQFDDGIPILSLCTVLVDAEGLAYGLSILNFDLNKLAQELYEIVNFAHSGYFQISYSIIIPLITPNQTVYIRAIKINATGGYAITPQKVSSNIVENILPVVSSVDDTITVDGSQTLIIGPLIIQDDIAEQSSMIYLGSKNNYIATDLSDSTVFITQINLTIGLIVGLIALASIITVAIMKTIMNNLDEELIELSNYCGFIVEDDLKIEIPVYEGTKDVKEVYQRVRVINKLNKYSHPNYFTGHYIDKILFYSQAQKILKNINYDCGAVLQNIGNCYFYMEQVDKTIQYYKQSVRSILSKIRQQYGTIDEIFQWKQQSRLPKAYRECEVVLIRRLFNLIESYNCLLQCHLGKDMKEKENELIKDILDYIDLFKKAVYPDFHIYAEFILVLFYEIKMRLYKNNVDIAQRILWKAETLCDIYINNYAEIGKKMKEKGSKNKLLHSKNRITSHSRMHPQKIKTFCSYFKALVLLKISGHNNRYEALKILFQGTKVSIFSNRITWMIFKKIHGILQYYNISQHRLFCLSMYNQIYLLKDIKQKQFHSESCPYRYPSQVPKNEQEYVYLIDCLANNSSAAIQSYFQNRAIHIYQKSIKDNDRVSIIKFNTLQGIKVQCNLTMKESKAAILKKEIYESFLEQGSYRFLKNELFQAFEKVIYRIMKLRSEKVILIFFQSLLKYRSHLHYIRKKEKSHVKRMNSLPMDQSIIKEFLPVPQFKEFGEWIINIIRESRIEKCKICLLCDEGDKIQEFRQFFGLNQINRRLWREDSGINIYHNTVFTIQKDHKVDIERILSKRVYSIPDNHIFIL